MNLTATCIRVENVSEEQINAMFRIFETNYVCDEQTFRCDFARKSWVIQLFDHHHILRGFSTFVLWSHNLGTSYINVVFAGDTIIDPRYWGHWALPIKWLEVTGALQAQQPSRPLYWLLTSMHPRTYRFLPLFYWHFYSSWRADDAELSRIAGHVARVRFGESFDATRGVVVGEGSLKESLATVAPTKMRRADIRYFLECNPGHASGDELVCLAHLEPANHRPLARRFFLRGAALGLGDYQYMTRPSPRKSAAEEPGEPLALC